MHAPFLNSFLFRVEISCQRQSDKSLRVCRKQRLELLARLVFCFGLFPAPNRTMMRPWITTLIVCLAFIVSSVDAQCGLQCLNEGSINMVTCTCTCPSTYRAPDCRYNDNMIVRIHFTVTYPVTEVDSAGFIASLSSNALTTVPDRPAFVFLYASGNRSSTTGPSTITVDLRHETNPVGLAKAVVQEVTDGAAWARSMSITTATTTDTDGFKLSLNVVILEINGASITLLNIAYVLAAIVIMFVVCVAECCGTRNHEVEQGWEPLDEDLTIPVEMLGESGELDVEKAASWTAKRDEMSVVPAPGSPGKNPLQAKAVDDASSS